jgi:hypothetical protein
MMKIHLFLAQTLIGLAAGSTLVLEEEVERNATGYQIATRSILTAAVEICR